MAIDLRYCIIEYYIHVNIYIYSSIYKHFTYDHWLIWIYTICLTFHKAEHIFCSSGPKPGGLKSSITSRTQKPERNRTNNDNNNKSKQNLYLISSGVFHLLHLLLHFIFVIVAILLCRCSLIKINTFLCRFFMRFYSIFPVLLLLFFRILPRVHLCLWHSLISLRRFIMATLRISHNLEQYCYLSATDWCCCFFLCCSCSQ